MQQDDIRRLARLPFRVGRYGEPGIGGKSLERIAEACGEQLAQPHRHVLGFRHHVCGVIGEGRETLAGAAPGKAMAPPAREQGDGGALHQALGVDHHIIGFRAQGGTDRRGGPAAQRFAGRFPQAPQRHRDGAPHGGVGLHQGNERLLDRPIECEAGHCAHGVRHRRERVHHVSEGGQLDHQNLHTRTARAAARTSSGAITSRQARVPSGHSRLWQGRQGSSRATTRARGPVGGVIFSELEP